MRRALSILLFAAIVVLVLWFMGRARAAQVESPKGKEHRLSLVKVSSGVPAIPKFAFVPTSFPIYFCVTCVNTNGQESDQSGYVTNLYRRTSITQAPPHLCFSWPPSPSLGIASYRLYWSRTNPIPDSAMFVSTTNTAACWPPPPKTNLVITVTMGDGSTVCMTNPTDPIRLWTNCSIASYRF
jgi:hypothetical protein